MTTNTSTRTFLNTNAAVRCCCCCCRCCCCTDRQPAGHREGRL